MTKNLNQNIAEMTSRYQAHVVQPNSLFEGRQSQSEIRDGIGEYFSEPELRQEPNGTIVTGDFPSAGYFVGPPRLGKTILTGDYIVGVNTTLDGEDVLGDPLRGKRTIICVPTNQLVDQWADKLLGKLNADGMREPSLFGDKIKPEHVGIYHADEGLTNEQKRDLLAKPIVIVTDGSVLSLLNHTDAKGRPDPMIRGSDFDLAIFDEVDSQLRGDVHNKAFKDAFIGKCQVIGMTATQHYKNGKTIGDYLFDGKPPICEITHREAINRQEIAPNMTITYEPVVDHLDSDIKVTQNNRWESFDDLKKERFINQTGSDDAAIKIVSQGTHPKTGKPLRELKQLWKGETIEHSKLFASKLNEKFGQGHPADEPYAAVVHGKMSRAEANAIIDKYKEGKIQALVQCKYIGRGFDDEDIELTGALAPSQSPNDLIQFFTRADTRRVTKNGKKEEEKIALHLTPRFAEMDQLNIGELLGGQHMFPPGFEYAPTAGKESAGATDAEPWPDIRGVKVYYTLEQMEQLAEILKKERYVRGLPAKSKQVLNVTEMAGKLGLSPEILQRRVYGPLEEAYDRREARAKFIERPEAADAENVIFTSGLKFPVDRLGFYQDRSVREQFCIDSRWEPLVRRALYGRLDRVADHPEVLSKDNAKMRLAASQDEIDTLWEGLQKGFFAARKPFARGIELEKEGRVITFPYADFNYHLNTAGKPELFIKPDALMAAHQFCKGSSEGAAKKWVQNSGPVKALKTTDWLTPAEIKRELHLTGDSVQELVTLWDEVKQKAGRLAMGDETNIRLGTDKRQLTIALKYLPQAEGDMNKKQICFPKAQLPWLKSQLGYEYSAKALQASAAGQARA